MPQLKKALNKLYKELDGTGAQLVAVSKYHPAEAIREAYDEGQRIFGESHVQELCAKAPSLPDDIEWHFIGHLQTNKVKYIAPFISLIHSVDTLKLLKEIDRQASKCGRTIDCLLQLHIAKEETKFGFLPEEISAILSQNEWKELRNVRIRGLMCMATNTDDEQQIRGEFHEAHAIFEHLKATYFTDNASFNQLSMGMSDDYPIALAEGSTLIRVGSLIFGERNYG